MVLVFYFLCIVSMVVIRPILNKKFLKNGKSALYSALYFLPVIALLHTVVGGLVCKYHFPFHEPCKLISNYQLITINYYRLCFSIFEHYHFNGFECSSFLHEIRSNNEITFHDIIHRNEKCNYNWYAIF